RSKSLELTDHLARTTGLRNERSPRRADRLEDPHVHRVQRSFDLIVFFIGNALVVDFGSSYVLFERFWLHENRRLFFVWVQIDPDLLAARKTLKLVIPHLPVFGLVEPDLSS